MRVNVRVSVDVDPAAVIRVLRLQDSDEVPEAINDLAQSLIEGHLDAMQVSA